jgi:hypothetical protein
VVAIEMVNHRGGGGATPHLAADGFGDTANPAADPDGERVGTGVAAIPLVAVDAGRCDAYELFAIGDDGIELVAVIEIAVRGLGLIHF